MSLQTNNNIPHDQMTFISQFHFLESSLNSFEFTRQKFKTNYQLLIN